MMKEFNEEVILPLEAEKSKILKMIDIIRNENIFILFHAKWGAHFRAE